MFDWLIDWWLYADPFEEDDITTEEDETNIYVNKKET